MYEYTYTGKDTSVDMILASLSYVLHIFIPTDITDIHFPALQT